MNGSGDGGGQACGPTKALQPVNLSRLSEPNGLSRRGFLTGIGGTAGALVLGVPTDGGALPIMPVPHGGLPDGKPFDDLALPPIAVTAFVKIAPSEIVLVLPRSEMGQGVSTVLPMLLAEELECPWEQVRVEMAPADSPYINPSFGIMATGASTSLRSSFAPLRQAGAAAREMLRAAAAQLWDVAVAECQVDRGVIRHPPSGRAAGYGALAPTAALLKVPAPVALKAPEQWQLLGRSLPRLDLPAKTAGTARFGIDITLPDLSVALVRHCPYPGGRLDGVDADGMPAALRSRVTVVPLEDLAAVAVVADRTWTARKALEALTLTWRRGPGVAADDAQVDARLAAGLEGGTRPVGGRGDVEDARRRASRTVAATYQVPFLAHATPEPTTCTARVSGDRCDVWMPTQGQTMLQRTVARALGLPATAVAVHTTLLGGGFGLRYEPAVAVEAARLARTMDRPVKVIWDRAEDFRRDYFRPAALSRVEVHLDAEGLPRGWRHRVAAPSILSRTFPHLIEDGIDQTATEGILDQPYAIDAMDLRYAMVETGIPVGFWRSVGRSINAFSVESLLDEAAVAAGRDPMALRRHLLRDSPRGLAVLDAVATLGGWATGVETDATEPPVRRGRGVAFHHAFRSFIAMVVDVAVDADRRFTVERIAVACDVGRVIHPDCVLQQIRGGAAFALSAAALESIGIADGQVVERDFEAYPLLRLGQMPEIAVTLLDSSDDPGGVGELAVPPLPPALANALFAATGERVRRLPVRRAGFILKKSDAV